MLSWGLQTPFEALFSAYASQSGLGPRLPPPPPPVLRLRAAIGEPLAVADAGVCLLIRFRLLPPCQLINPYMQSAYYHLGCQMSIIS